MTTSAPAHEPDLDPDAAARHVLEQLVVGLQHGMGQVVGLITTLRREVAEVREAQGAAHMVATSQKLTLDEILRRVADLAESQAQPNGVSGARGETADAHS